MHVRQHPVVNRLTDTSVVVMRPEYVVRYPAGMGYTYGYCICDWKVPLFLLPTMTITMLILKLKI